MVVIKENGQDCKWQTDPGMNFWYPAPQSCQTNLTDQCFEKQKSETSKTPSACPHGIIFANKPVPFLYW